MRRLIVLLTLGLLAASCGDDAATQPSDDVPTSAEAPSTTQAGITTLPPTTTEPAPTTTEPPNTVAPAPTPPPTIAESLRERVQTSGNLNGSAAARLRDDGTPVFAGDFADPFVLPADGGFYLYATNTAAANVPVVFANAGGGEYLGDGLPVLPEWTNSLWNWAPSVAEIDGTYVLYYTTRHEASGRQCISVATADAPGGPFVDDSTEPLVCSLDLGGSIDPSPFVDADGSRWLLWKSDGNCCGIPTRIYAQPMTDDGLAFTGDPVELIRNDLGWERDVVEGPSMIEVDGEYHLFYSANRWDTPDYAVGRAVCESVTGPCVKDPEPWLSSETLGAEGVLGPGGLEVVDLDNRVADLVVFHAWTGGEVGYETGQRALFIEPIRWSDGDPVIVGSLLPDEPLAGALSERVRRSSTE
ncbi:MAG: glycoside hydrolase family 43 protein [Actinomycetota bacterium]